MKCLTIFLAVAATVFVNLFIPASADAPHADTTDSLHIGAIRPTPCQDTLFSLQRNCEKVLFILPQKPF